jgi:hypothetical protein
MEDFFMLMKMSQYKSVMFTVSICIGSILLAILVAYACDLDALREARDKAARDYHDARQALIEHESEWLGALLWGGGIGGGSAAGGTFFVTGSFSAASKIIPGGIAIGTIASISCVD